MKGGIRDKIEKKEKKAINGTEREGERGEIKTRQGDKEREAER